MTQRKQRGKVRDGEMEAVGTDHTLEFHGCVFSVLTCPSAKTFGWKKPGVVKRNVGGLFGYSAPRQAGDDESRIKYSQEEAHERKHAHEGTIPCINEPT